MLGPGPALVWGEPGLATSLVRTEIRASVQTLGGRVLAPMGPWTPGVSSTPQAGAGLAFSPLWLRWVCWVSDHPPVW